MTLADRLNEWRDRLTRLGVPVAPLLAPGADRAEIEAVLGTPVPPAVSDWFAWCDGVAYAPGQTIGDSWAVPGYWPLALRDAIGMKPAYDQLDVPLLREHWVPLLGNGSSDIYAATWDDADGEPVVVSIMPEYGDAVEFDSIEQMVIVFNQCFARSAYHLDEQGRLDVDDELYAEVYEAVVGRAPDD